jgi:hypothetical protein
MLERLERGAAVLVNCDDLAINDGAGGVQARRAGDEGG